MCYFWKVCGVCGTPYTKQIISLKVCGVCGRTLQGLWEVCGTPCANFGRSVGSVGLHLLNELQVCGVCGTPYAIQTGAPVAFKTWCGHQYRVGIICPPRLRQVKVAAKTWCGHVPTSTCLQARLRYYCTECPNPEHQVNFAKITEQDEIARLNLNRLFPL